jgi:hypothetical protein
MNLDWAYRPPSIEPVAFSAPKVSPPPPPAPPPNPPTFASAVVPANRGNRAASGGMASTIFTSPQGLVDAATPGRKTLLGQ